MIHNNLKTSPLGKLPYANGAKLITNFLTFFITTLPHMVDQGLASSALYKTLDKMDSSALEKVGISRSDIPAYVASKMGYVAANDSRAQGEFDLEAANDDRILAA